MIEVIILDWGTFCTEDSPYMKKCGRVYVRNLWQRGSMLDKDGNPVYFRKLMYKDISFVNMRIIVHEIDKPDWFDHTKEEFDKPKMVLQGLRSVKPEVL